MAQRGSHKPTLRPKYIPYTYMDPLGSPLFHHCTTYPNTPFHSKRLLLSKLCGAISVSMWEFLKMGRALRDPLPRGHSHQQMFIRDMLRASQRASHIGVSQQHVFKGYLEGQGDLVSRLITPITHIITLMISIINLLTKSP